MSNVTICLRKDFGMKLTRVIEHFSQVADKVSLQEIWLFGSTARGSYDSTSDLDVMLIVREGTDLRSVRKYADELDFGLSPEVDITVRTLRMLQESDYVFSECVLRDKIVLWSR